MKAPVVMIGYIRRTTLEKSLTHLAQCHGVSDRDVYLYLDAPYCDAHQLDSDRMVETALSFKGNGLPQLQVIRREKNFGIPANHVSAITEIVEKYGRVIVFEDDVCVSHTFLDYMDKALELYENDKRIFCVNAFFPVYMRHPKCDVWLQPRMSAWGCGFWVDRWRNVDFDLKDFDPGDKQIKTILDRSGLDVHQMCCAIKNGSLRTWDAQCTYYMALHDMYAVTPRYSLTKNIGYGVGLHCRANAYLAKLKYYDFTPILSEKVQPDSQILQMFLHRPATLCERVFYFILKYLCVVFFDKHEMPSTID